MKPDRNTNPSRAMPRRPKAHVNEEGSKKAFLAQIPDEWTTSKPESDYGVDLVVNTFVAGSATGLQFNVQLKSKESVGKAANVSVDQSTRNYWQALDSPTLIVLWDAQTSELWHEWAHLVDTYGRKPGAKTATIHFSEKWNSASVDAIQAEVQAVRASKTPSLHTPIFIEFANAGAFLGTGSRRIVGQLTRDLSTSRDLTLIKARQTDLNVLVTFESTFVKLRLSGNHPQFMHYDKINGFLTRELEFGIAADIEVMLSFALGSLGLTRLAMQVLTKAIPQSSLALDPGRVGDIAAELARDHEVALLQTLLLRVFAEGTEEAQTVTQLSLSSVSDQLSSAERQQLATTLERSANNGPAAASMLYNAGNFIRRDDYERARSLYERAAVKNPSYRTRGYWWSEQGGTYFLEGNLSEAARFYRRAVDLGHRDSLPLLADTELHLGRYEDALVSFGLTNSDSELSKAQWRLSEFAFGYIVEQRGIRRQSRQPGQAQSMWPPDSEAEYPKVIDAVLKADLLFSPALWAATHEERSAGRPTLPYFVAAALGDPGFPVVWEEAARTAFVLQSQLLFDIIDCIKFFCREDFVAFLHEADDVTEGDREALLFLLSYLPEPDGEKQTVRNENGEIVFQASR
ncbi:DUF4365 domain-containing protein [Lacisediminihabitans sp. FW035]